MAEAQTPAASDTASGTRASTTSHLEEADPFYLHPNESPAIVLVTPLLNEHNHMSWSRAVEMALWSKHKIGFIDGTIHVPSVDDARYVSWKRNNTMISSWIIRSVEPRIAQSIMWFETAYELWEDLKDRYGRGDNMRISNLQAQIFSLRQGALTISDYFSQYRVLWDQMEQYRPLPHCKCKTLVDPCDCELYRLVKGYRSSDLVIGFLRGLNDTYAHVCEQILMMEPMPTISRVLFLALQQERRSMSIHTPVLPAANMTIDESMSSVLAAQSNGRRFWNNNYNRPQCTYCNRAGHTVDKCYKKHGFPPNYKPRGSGSGQHERSNHPTNGGGSTWNTSYSANAVNASTVTAVSRYPSQSDATNLVTEFNRLGLSQNQLNGLLSLMQQAGPGSSNVQSNHSAAPAISTPIQSNLHMSGPAIFENDW